MKTKEELDALREEVATVNAKLAELSDEELAQVAGGDVTSANIVGYNAQVVGAKPGNGVILVGVAPDEEVPGISKILKKPLRNDTDTVNNCKNIGDITGDFTGNYVGKQ